MHRKVICAVLVAGLSFLAFGGSSACGKSPTAPENVALTGVWVGALPLRIPGEDWSVSRISLVQVSATFNGELSGRNGTRFPLTGTRTADGALLSVGGLPGTSICAEIDLFVSSVDVTGGHADTLSGRAMGRCYGTVDGEFTLHRTD